MSSGLHSQTCRFVNVPAPVNVSCDREWSRLVGEDNARLGTAVKVALQVGTGRVTRSQQRCLCTEQSRKSPESTTTTRFKREREREMVFPCSFAPKSPRGDVRLSFHEAPLETTNKLGTSTNTGKSVQSLKNAPT